MAKGKKVKYVIDADTSGFVRGMSEAALASETAEKSINKNLSKVAKVSEGSFKKVNRSAASTISSIRNLANNFQTFSTKSAINKTAALNNAVLSLSQSLSKINVNKSVLSGIDTSGITRLTSAYSSASSVLDKGFNKSSKKAENNFKDISRNAADAASQIRNFAVAFQAFNVSAIVVGITALTGVVFELAGALAAASSTAVILVPALAQGAAAAATFQNGLFGLSDAFDAIQKNDGDAFTESLQNLGPASKQVALSVAGLNQAFNGIRLNVQQALFADLGDTILRLGASVLPVLNTGMQQVAQSFNAAFKSAAALSDTPLFRGLISTIFADTARNIQVLSGALAPVLSIFTNLYLVTAPYVTLLAQQFVNLTKTAAAYLGSVRGQTALNLAIQKGLVALRSLGQLAGAVFGLLTSVFATAVNAGNSLIPTLTSIVRRMEAFVNSATGQAQLIALFNFTSLAVQAVASAIGNALQFFFSIIQAINSLNPAVQTFVINTLAASIVIRPLIGFLSQLYLAVRVLAVTLFNFGQQALVVFGALGAISSVALVIAGALVVLGAVIRGPLGGALLIVGAAIAAYIGLSYLATVASTAAANSFYRQGTAALVASGQQQALSGANILLATTMYNVAAAAVGAGVGMSFAARAAVFLRAAILPLIVLASGALVVLSILGVFSSKTKEAKDSTAGFSSSLASLQKAMKGVNATGNSASTNGLSALNSSLASVGTAAETAKGSLASFDKLNVLEDSSTANAGISGIPTLPGLGTIAPAIPTVDTSEFDNALSDMQKNFDSLKKDIAKPISNPFDAVGKFINDRPWVFLAVFGAVVIGVAAAFIFLNAAAFPITLTLGLIALAVVAIIAIIILLAKNWDTVWAAIKSTASGVGNFLQGIWNGIVSGVQNAIGAVGSFFAGMWESIVLAATVFLQVFVGLFQGAWDGVVLAWGVAVDFFQGVWNGITGIFSTVGVFFGNVFGSAWEAVKRSFSKVTEFFRGVWDGIVGIFKRVGSAIGDAVGNAFKVAINGVLGFLETEINGIVNIVNGALKAVDDITPGSIPRLDRVAIPRLAKGAVVSSPTIAQIGEAGEEAVMPLENNTEWIDKLAAKINLSNNSDRAMNDTHLPSRLERQDQVQPVTIQVSGVFATSVAEQRKVADIIYKRLNELNGNRTAKAF